MNQNTQKYVKIEAKGFQDLCNRIGKLEAENKQLQANNKVIGDELTYFKERCADLESEINDITSMSMFAFANKYCNNKELEEAGASFARSLLDSRADIEEIEAIRDGENHYYKTGVALYGDDF